MKRSCLVDYVVLGVFQKILPTASTVVLHNQCFHLILHNITHCVWTMRTKLIEMKCWTVKICFLFIYFQSQIHCILHCRQENTVKPHFGYVHHSGNVLKKSLLTNVFDWLRFTCKTLTQVLQVEWEHQTSTQLSKFSTKTFIQLIRAWLL